LQKEEQISLLNTSTYTQSHTLLYNDQYTELLGDTVAQSYSPGARF